MPYTKIFVTQKMLLYEFKNECSRNLERPEIKPIFFSDGSNFNLTGRVEEDRRIYSGE